jgi:hypothetical protein
MIKPELLERFLSSDLADGYYCDHAPEDADAPELTIEDVAIVCPDGVGPPSHPYGAIVQADGTVYVLIRQMYHGVLSALLYPELAKQFGYELPRRDCGVFKYQRVQFIADSVTSNVVVSSNPYSMTSIHYNDQVPVTKTQAFRTVQFLAGLGFSGEDTVRARWGEVALNDLEEHLLKGHI